MKKILLLSFVFITILLFGVMAQRTVSGRITDENGESLLGVNVVIKGTTTGVITDIDGNYRISVEEGATLVFSYIGFEGREEVVGSRTTIDVSLASEVSELEQVVVTGYGDISKRLYTGASQSLTAKEVDIEGIGDVSQMLQGKAAGVNVQSVSGTFGAGPRITIRGSSSIQGDGRPLWVIDGVVQEDLINLDFDDLVSGNINTLIGSAVAGLNPNDIESLEILRDASATAIYGSRSLNGVIVITTKQGKRNQPLQVNYSGEFTIRDTPTYAEADILNSKENMSILKELERKGRLDYTTVSQNRYSGVYGILSNALKNYNPSTGRYEVDNTPQSRDNFLQTYERANTDWFDELFKQRSLIQNHTISLSGGGGDNLFYGSVGLYRDAGWAISDDVDRLTVNLRNTLFVKEKASLTLSLLGSYRRQLAPGSFNRQDDTVFGTVSRDFDINPYSYALNTSRTLRPRDDNGDLEYYTYNYAPMNILNESENNFVNLKVQDIKFQTDFSIPLFDDKLKYAFTGAIRYANSVSEHNITDNSNVAAAYRSAETTVIRDNNPYLFDDPENPTRPPKVVLPEGGIFIQSTNFLRNFYLRNTLNFSNTFNTRHELDVFLGQEMRYVDRDETTFTGYGLLYQGGLVPRIDSDIIAKSVNEGSDYYGLEFTRERTVSYFSRVTYGFDGKYFISFTGNLNASNRQGLKDGKVRWTPTYTFSGKWNAKEETFLRNVKPITTMALRASYGLTANTGPATNTLPVFDFYITDRLLANDRETAIRIDDLQNDDLTWEKQYETNLGLDLGLFQNSINITVDAYRRDGFDLFDFVQQSGVGGELSKLINNADMVTKGLEVQIRTNMYKGDFRWTTTLNGSIFDQEITKIEALPNVLNATDDTGASFIGFPRNSLFSLQFTGLDSRGLPTYDLPEENKTFDVNFQDTGVEIEPSEDGPGGLLSYLKYEGPTDPNKTLGLQNSFSYKNWSLNIFITASGGNKIRLPAVFQNGASFDDLQVYSRDFVNRWVLPGDEEITNFPVIPDSRLLEDVPESEINRAYNAYNFSTERVADGTFVRVRTISLSYNVPKDLLSRIGMRSATVTGLVQNPLLLYSDDKLNGVDPEFYNSGGVAQPITRQYTFTLNIGI
ncbi:MAG: SusC/RagA family TonB-linked outer membrane protein [Ekhidna sp.]|nr:SusC/RagA family TonB-linked outer membrane protein [Ekhidna sp.]MBC6409131.1 SusC/RagA family TonB-linked outer membrane protein [Ekhidna sp.]